VRAGNEKPGTPDSGRSERFEGTKDRRQPKLQNTKDDLINAGATWVDAAALRDGHLVWGRVVADIPAFCRELVAALVERA